MPRQDPHAKESKFENRILVVAYELCEHFLTYICDADGWSQSKPRRWEDVVLSVSRDLNIEVATPSRRIFGKRGVIWFLWNPSALIGLLSLFAPSGVYLCWGVPAGSSRLGRFLRGLRLQFFLRRAAIVLVNDQFTMRYCKERTDKPVRLIPYVVDTKFFFPAEVLAHNYYLVPGNVDRDEELVCRLAESGLAIVRVTASRQVERLYAECDFRNSGVRLAYKVTFTELRSLYQNALGTLVPLKTVSHPAGQTCILESLACGTPVFVREGFSASIFTGYQGVRIVKDNDLVSWLSAIAEERTKERIALHSPIDALHGFDSVSSIVIEVFREHLS